MTQTARYWVRVSNFFGAVNSAAAELVVSLGFTDDLITEHVSAVRAVHIMELRTRINAARVGAGLPATTFTDATLTAQQTVIRAVHIAELRSSLSEVYTGAAAGGSHVYTCEPRRGHRSPHSYRRTAGRGRRD